MEGNTSHSWEGVEKTELALTLLARPFSGRQHTEVLDCGVSARTQAGITQVAAVVWEWGAYRLETLGHTRLVPGLRFTWKQVLSASSIQEVGSPI